MGLKLFKVPAHFASSLANSLVFPLKHSSHVFSLLAHTKAFTWLIFPLAVLSLVLVWLPQINAGTSFCVYAYALPSSRNKAYYQVRNRKLISRIPLLWFLDRQYFSSKWLIAFVIMIIAYVKGNFRIPFSRNSNCHNLSVLLRVTLCIQSYTYAR